ncbi:MAG: HPF/RaiA family ribosome-associated protein [Candidatus Calescibacterium sp.]|nr:HPF/RaiA family ribosome-associated protein [Candidatus Calescibacterium sp.]MCX7972282.1 HPF/RaiA family ribosome-associated protein [bacterium]MDW8195115.1 HPF/RaiA family ribosome-associated protein [Candidatus Calescibacterium sp.]
MKITFYTRGVDLDDQMRLKIKEKFDRLNRYFSKIEKYQNEDTLTIDIHIDYQKGIYNVKIILDLDGQEVVIKDSANNLMDVINSVIDSMEIRLSKYKDKVITGHRHRIRLVETSENQEPTHHEVDIIRKRLEVPVISERKAINALLQDNSLYYLVFYNRDTDKINLLTRTESGLVLTELVI